MTDAELVESLATTMARHNLTGVVLVRDGLRLRLRRERAPTAAALPAEPGTVLPFQANGKALRTEVRTPTAGTWSTRETPAAAPYIAVGQRVTPTSVVGLVLDSAGTVNEIVSEVEGVASKILVTDNTTVKAGDVLVEVEARG